MKRFFGQWARMLAYPITRAASDIGSSASQVAKAAALAKADLRRKQADAVAAKGFLSDLTPSEKFEKVYALNDWTEDQLRQQIVATTRTRRALLVLACFGLVSVLALTWVLAWQIMAFLGSAGMILFAGCFVLATRYAWWNYCLETRTLIALGEFIGRPDLFQRVFS